MKIGVISSSGGGAFAASYAIAKTAFPQFEFAMITDRSCGAREFARTEGLQNFQIDYTSREDFSSRVLEIFSENQIDVGLLFFSRLLSKPLITAKPIFNIHPSILPMFPGLHGLRDTMASKSRLIGATLHRVDSGIDTGDIIAQVACGFNPNTTVEKINRLSYLQKINLTLTFFSLLEIGFFDQTYMPRWNLLNDFGTQQGSFPGIQSACAQNLFQELEEKLAVSP